MLAYITEKLLNNLSLKYLLLVYEIIAEKHGCRERLYIILTFFFSYRSERPVVETTAELGGAREFEVSNRRLWKSCVGGEQGGEGYYGMGECWQVRATQCTDGTSLPRPSVAAAKSELISVMYHGFITLVVCKA